MQVKRRAKMGRSGFGGRVACLRNQKGWTLAELGREVGVSGTCVWNWEEGNTHPRHGSLQRLAAALKVSPESLLDGDNPELPAKTDDRSLNKVESKDRGSLSDLISRSRVKIAEAAGLPISNVKVILDYGE